ncbi:adenosylcobinamide-GDP ribazoletransferase [Microbaculum marinum]|uniref:Adenosylcobinamide-GDP ribazoletransferase n=1 Tax=Microbaculum marinum TaxID=1764581 RepID=A0AAW9RTL6_9HYPH
MSRHAELAAAFGLLTRLPTGWIADPAERPDPARAVWAYPFAGLAVGAISGGVYWLTHVIGVPSFIAGVFALGSMVLATGAMHEDGAADTADGLGGGADRAGKLEIMRDSRIGTYGVIALILIFALRLSVIGTLADAALVAAALMATAALSRGAIVPLMHWLGPARADGLAVHVGQAGRNATAEAAAIAALTAFLLLPFATALAAILAAAIGAAIVGLLARSQLGGQTGDILGAACVAAECAALTAIVSITAPG